MSCIGRQIDQLRLQIPGFACKPGCHDCCGPVTASSEEMARLPVKSEAEHDAALAEWNCVHLGPNGCEAYEERPLICRLFGTTPNLLLPGGAGARSAGGGAGGATGACADRQHSPGAGVAACPPLGFRGLGGAGLQGRFEGWFGRRFL